MSWFPAVCRMAGRLLSRLTRSSRLLAARGLIKQDNHVASQALPAALRDEYYPKLGKLFECYNAVLHSVSHGSLLVYA